MHVLVVGGGGREHAIAWKLTHSPRVTTVSVAPGNAGTARSAGIRNVAISADDIDSLIDYAISHDVALTVVGPEAPLVSGIVDRFQDAGLRIFGPRAGAARLEGSKSFSKAFLARHAIPTARFETFTHLSDALHYIDSRGAPIVIKADGLAAGKGVVVAHTLAEACAAATDMLEGNRFGDAGARIVVEDFLVGEEASFICVVDGQTALPLASSQDHKARDDGDRGPNTGGMGAYSPAPVVTQAVHDRVMREVIEPTVAGMAAEGNAFVGFLYAGLMIDDTGAPYVIEFNVRCGDPETQPIMARLNSDLCALCEAAIDSALAGVTVDWDPRPALGVVLAAEGYPESYPTGQVISGLEADAEDALVFHDGTAEHGGEVVTSGGRVLCVVGIGDSLRVARDSAYARVDSIHWDNRVFRTDIGHRALR
ncbi:MAG: phosphoribosylamine--glycine ligase [Pseudomonadota bacterium]